MASLIKQRAPWASFSRSFRSSSIQGQMAVPLEEELRTAKPTSEIPGPKVYPVVGTLPAMLLSKDFDKKMYHRHYTALHAKYGPTFRIIVPSMNPIVAMTNPDDCERLLRFTMHNPLRMPMSSLKAVREETVDDFFEKKTGLLIENGDEWWRVRSKVQTPMMKPKLVGTYLQQMDEVSIDFTDRIAELQAEHGEMPSNFQFELYKWALESVGLVALNRRLGCLDPDIPEGSDSLRLIEIVNDILQAVNDIEVSSGLWKILRTPSFKKLKKRHEQFLEIAVRNVQETEAAILAQDPDSERELSLMENLLMTEGLSKKDVVTLILDMLFAGIDTVRELKCLAEAKASELMSIRIK
ncbi:probable cytochrome P450 49a1 [Penaeus japonicus]|uniref:probable cytochrome P450 49a1 n=1 Tax=Penaeus japonicus TaxID=27405 RepID=UPI001C70CC76|nr:probable cytochrome P450 49a1 [Penaeus japonicus]